MHLIFIFKTNFCLHSRENTKSSKNVHGRNKINHDLKNMVPQFGKVLCVKFFLKFLWNISLHGFVYYFVLFQI